MHQYFESSSIQDDFHHRSPLISYHHQAVRVPTHYRRASPDVLCRLEAATSRLEDLAALGSTSGQSQLTTALSPQSAEPTPVPPPPPHPTTSAPAAESPPAFTAYNEVIIEGKLKAFVELTRSFASESVIEQVCIPGLLLRIQRALIWSVVHLHPRVLDIALGERIRASWRDYPPCCGVQETE